MMSSLKLTNILNLISENLAEKDIPYCLIGAFALSIYGLPKYTSDIDLLTEGRFWPMISSIMKRLGYTCFQKTRSFAQFDSELGVYGKVDFMFVNTPEGKDILKRSTLIEDALLGNHPVLQPTDYIILKLMAIANNPERGPKDEADIHDVLRLYKEDLIFSKFEPLNKDRIFLFAEWFGQKDRVLSLFNKVVGVSDIPEQHKL